jgi:hypothetical protein
MAKKLSKTFKALIAIVVVLVAIVVIITVTGLIGDKTVSGAVEQAGKEAEMYFAHMDRDGEGNAWHYYAKAMKAAEGIASDRELIGYLDGKEEPTHELMQSILDNLEIIEYLEEGTRQEYCMLPHEYERGLESPLPEYVALRRAVSIACVKALYDLENGRSEEALALLFSTMIVGKHISSSPMIIDQMVGSALVGRSMEVLKIGIASRAFDQKQLGEIAEFLDDLEKHWPMFTDAILADIDLMRISFARYGQNITSLLVMGNESTEHLGFMRMLALRLLSWHDWFSPIRAIHSSLSFFEGLEDELRTYESVLLDETASKDSVQRRWTPIETRIASFRKRNFWFGLSCPEYASMFKQRAERITMIRMMGLSSLLASHRHATGGFPEKLVEIAPHLIVDIRTREPWEYMNYGDSARISSPGIDGDTMSITVTNMSIGQYLEKLRRRDAKEESKQKEKREVK